MILKEQSDVEMKGLFASMCVRVKVWNTIEGCCRTAVVHFHVNFTFDTTASRAKCELNMEMYKPCKGCQGSVSVHFVGDT